MSNLSCAMWTQDEVCTWLGNLSMHHLVPNFERMQIDGSKLVKLSDQDLRGALRLTKPAEVMAIRGAIKKLIEDSSKPPPSRRVSAAPRLTTHVGSLSPRERAGSIEKKTRTHPWDTHRHTTIATETVRQPKLVQGSAPELIDKECKYSGWIRKQGGGYKNWKRRYLILRLGCLYYFANETASSAKGSFVLSGYKTEICHEPEIIKKYKYTLKLCPMNPQVRTYYISVGSERELLGWKDAMDKEIRMVSRRISLEVRQNSTDTLPAYPHGQNSYDDDDDDDDEDNPYDVPEGFQDDEDDEHNYDDPESVIYDKPELDSEEDDPYTKIEDDFPGRGLPTAPPRSPFSLQSPTGTGMSAVVAAVSARTAAIKEEGGENPEDTYLPIIAGGPARNPSAAQPDLSRSVSSPTNHSVAFSAPPSTAPFGQDDHDYVDDGPESGNDDEDDDDDGGYYIMFRKPEELMPQSCLFDRLERSEADRLLKEKNRDGTYLIRGGSHAGAEKVLSVWHIDRCRHYKLFKDDNSSYSLTQGQLFRTIPELLQYYTLQSHLPKSDFYLGDPYNPDDH